jgi:hypothetical protein
MFQCRYDITLILHVLLFSCLTYHIEQICFDNSNADFYKVLPVSCGEPAISLHSHTVSLVQWVNPLLPIIRDPGSIPRGYFCETGILQFVLSRNIGDYDVIDHCGLVWGRLRPESSLGRRHDNVIIPLDLTQPFCPSFTLAAGPPGFTTDIVGC